MSWGGINKVLRDTDSKGSLWVEYRPTGASKKLGEDQMRELILTAATATQDELGPEDTEDTEEFYTYFRHTALLPSGRWMIELVIGDDEEAQAWLTGYAARLGAAGLTGSLGPQRLEQLPEWADRYPPVPTAMLWWTLDTKELAQPASRPTAAGGWPPPRTPT